MEKVSIYKTDSKAKLRVLEIEAVGGVLYQRAGLDGGKLTEHSKVCTPKNVGKTNETSSEQQAIAQAQALIAKKLRKDYFATAEQALNTEVVMPMLAKDFFKEKSKVVYPCYGQPKLDGVRGLGKEFTLNSRENLPIETLEHIRSSFVGLSEWIDGELYAHGLTFQENMKLIKKYRPGQTENVRYHVYDMISDKPFIERYQRLAELVKDNPMVELVPTVVIHSEEELKKYHEHCIAQGYEGCMLRWGRDGYKVSGRSINLLKYKMFFDVALPVVDITPNEADPTHGTVWVEYKGKRTKTGARLSHEDRKELLLNRQNYIGKTAEIRYFEETDDGLLRFPVFVGFRLDK